MATIGYTMGVFDMFHIGHLNLLRRARNLCDQLIVGVATDELALSRKGRTPIVPFVERMDIVQSLRYVDSVVPYADPDRLSTWQDLRFNVIFKGSDWVDTPEFGALAERCRPLGVEIVYLPYTRQTSTTILRQRVFRD